MYQQRDVQYMCLPVLRMQQLEVQISRAFWHLQVGAAEAWLFFFGFFQPFGSLALQSPLERGRCTRSLAQQASEATEFLMIFLWEFFSDFLYTQSHLMVLMG